MVVQHSTLEIVLKLSITLFIFASTISFAQKSKDRYLTNHPRLAGFKLGVVASEFFRENAERFQQIPNEPYLGITTGLIIDIVNFKRFASQIELAYTMKGARETFINGSETIYSSARLHYVQADIIPFQLKPFGYNRFNPYISAGGYFSYLLDTKIDFTVERTFFETKFTDVFEDADFSTVLSRRDYGINLNAGIKMSGVSLEYRYEFGMEPLFFNRQIKNQLHCLALKLTY